MSIEPFSEERPWGSFRTFTKNLPSTVKTLFVKHGEAFSLQKHNHRTEFWRVLLGNPEITIGDKIINAKPGDEFHIPLETNHRITATNGDTEVLEISLGEFDEQDIVRIEDKYGRV